MAPIARDTGRDSEEEALREALRRAPQAATSPVADARVDNVLRDVFVTKRRGATRQVMMIVRDAFRRGAPQAELEAFPRQLLAIVRGWFRAQRGETLPRFEDAHQREEELQGAREAAETRFCHDRSSPAAARAFINADTAYRIADEDLIAIAENVLVPRPTLAVVRGGMRTGVHADSHSRIRRGLVS